MKRRIEESLLQWKNSGIERKPLLINGARQVGKTWSLKEFGQKHYSNVVHVNLDINEHVAAYFNNDISPNHIIKMLEAEFKEAIEPESTLIILDEIQSSERALASLKYFCEEAPQYHVAAAGSLLGVAINRENYSFPVGKVKTVMLYPLDFEEYLWAQDEFLLAQEIKASFSTLKALPAALHIKALNLYREYLVVGGMPACVDKYVNGMRLIELPELQNEIVNNYVADMAKYATTSEAVKIRACYNSLPAQLGKDNHKFQYKVVRRGATAALFGEAIDWLDQAGVVLKCQKIEQGYQPLPASIDLSSFKLFMSDVGLLNMKAGTRQSDVLSGAPYHFQGAVAENYIAQQLVARNHQLYYWTSGNTAELDFVLQTQDGVTAVEVKSGQNTHSKSLNQFVKRYKPNRALRFSSKPFGSGADIAAIPLYAAFCL